MTKKKALGSRADGQRVRALGFGAVAVVAGVLSVVVLDAAIDGYRAELERVRAPEDTVMVMVAARDLYQGITIEESDLYAVQIPPRYLPEQVFLSPEHVIGRIPRERILANELVRSDRLADPESGRGLNAVIPRGMRALSVDLSDGRALAGFLTPGNYVDLLVTIDPVEEGGELVTRTVLQSVFVLGVDSRLGSEEEVKARSVRGKHPPSVTLLVTADQAETVAYAHAMGKVTLSLRSNDDLDPSTEVGEGVTLAQLRARVRPTLPPVRIRQPQTAPEHGVLRIWRGADGTSYKLDAEGRIVD